MIPFNPAATGVLRTRGIKPELMPERNKTPPRCSSEPTPALPWSGGGTPSLSRGGIHSCPCSFQEKSKGIREKKKKISSSSSVVL